MRIVILLCAVSLCAGQYTQTPGPVLPGPARFPAALRLYLELSDTQVENIIFLNNEYQRWAQARQRRMNQVRQELGDLLAREPLDPMAIGLAMAEIEATERQMRAEMDRTRAKIRAVLNEGQTKKLKALEEVLKLWPIYSEAVGVNLLDAPPLVPARSGRGEVIGVITGPDPPVSEP